LALLFVQGLLRSLQLLLLNIIGYSELTDREFSAASTISSMSQQMARGYRHRRHRRADDSG
jgi:hypothetical protein